MAKKYGAKIVGVDGFQQAVELLAQKRVDVTINDKLSFLDYKNKSRMHQSRLWQLLMMLLQAGSCLERKATHS